jgi:hypothetical protein
MSAESETGREIGRAVGGVPSPRVGDRDAAGVTTVSRGEGTPPTSRDSERGLGPRQWRQVALITIGAVALYAGFRVLPTGSNLNHIDFKTGGSPGSLEMCDPSNPQFIPVMAVRSPVSMSVTTEASAEAAQAGTTVKSTPVASGREIRGVVRLLTASGKPIGPVDLLVVHTRKLHLLVIDPTLTDYQHLHPEPAARDGEWAFAFTPRRGGVYRIFADFTPTATGRGLYAGAELLVEGLENGREGRRGASGVTAVLRGEGTPPTTEAETEADGDVGAPEYRVNRHGFVFSLSVAGGELHAGKPADLVFTITREGRGDVPLRPVMDAYAHLVAFDEARSGFAHLHPNEADLSHAPDARAPRLTFKITIPQRGRYVVWAQVNLDGVETFVPFPVEVK